MDNRTQPKSTHPMSEVAVRFDLLISGGTLIDPSTTREGRFDVAISRGRVAAVDPLIPADTAAMVIDASGLLVTPGLVDLHTHVFGGVGYFSIDAESVASRSGVTTWIDAGTAGAFTFPGFRQHAIDQSVVRILAFINISYIGLIGLNYDEYVNPLACDVGLVERVIEQHRDVVIGIKTRMGTGKFGNQGLEPLKAARTAAERCDLPLMVHIATAPPAVEDVLALMRPGDVLTHAFTGLTERLVDDHGGVRPAARDARERGILFDIGHGSGSFSFESAEVLSGAGIWPDTISTDIHQVSLPGPNLLDPLAQDLIARVRGDGSPAFTLLTVMSKFLHLGMPLADIVRATTERPAQISGLAGAAGTLAVGAPADVAILRQVDGDFELYDIHGNRRRATRMLEHEQTIVRGRPLEPRPMPASPPWVRLVDQDPASD
jgi:dihydroorotase